MSFLNTKPRSHPWAIATENGWVDPTNGTLLVNIPNLKSIIEGKFINYAPIVIEQPIIDVSSTHIELDVVDAVIVEEELNKPPRNKKKHK
jgi:hypothetical protein